MSPLRQLWRQLAIGSAAGLAFGLILGALFVIAGFPEWTVTSWSFVAVVALDVLPLALALRAVMHGVSWATQLGIPNERRQPIPEEYLTSYWLGYVIGAAAITAHLVLTVVFAFGTGLTSPF